MNVRLVITIVAVILFTLTGTLACTSQSTPAPTKPVSSAVPAPAANTAPAVNTTPAQAVSGGGAITLRLGYFASPTQDAGPIIQKYIDQFNENAKNKYVIKFFAMGTLIALQESLDAVKTGAAELSIYPLGPFASQEKNFGLTETPLLYNNVAACAAGDQLITPDISQILEAKFNQKLLGAYTLGPLELICTKRQIKTAEDFKGLLMGSMTPGVTKLMAALGGSSVTTNNADMYTSLQRGTVDAGVIGIAGMSQNKLYEVSPNVTTGFFIPNAIAIAVNMKSYSSMPKDVQDALQAFGAGIAKDVNAYYVGPGYQGVKDKLTGLGAKVYDLPKVEHDKILTALKPTYDADFAAAGDFGKKLRQIVDQANQANPYPY